MNEIIFVFKVFVREEFIRLLSSYVRWNEESNIFAFWNRYVTRT